MYPRAWFVLAEWRPHGLAFELLVLWSDGTSQRTLMTFKGGCEDVGLKNLGWDQPRP